MTAGVPTEVMRWEQVGVAARSLAETIHADGYAPDIILAIARGGLIPAAALGYALGVKNTYTMNVEFYTDVDQRLEMPMVLPPVPEFVDVAHADLLIVDDVADTGLTLEVVHAFCAGKVANVRTAVLYEKPRSVVRGDYVWRRTDRWITFPWSAEPPVGGGSMGGG
ncbi:MAG TPA: phosphoribosyltransferase [Miltoncostaea sp.]|nr:phosphoribosyltransferase [Miltoncostaea sp.]